jgi:hypothetical protein
MTVAFSDGVIRLVDPCRLEEAEDLAVLLAAHPGRPVDVSGCSDLHSAVVQTLLSFGPPISGDFAEPFARRWLQPILTGESRSGMMRSTGKGLYDDA